MTETPACQGCGSFEPTAHVCFRQNVGKVVMLQLGTKKGPYCWKCGYRWFSTMTRTTLIKGWWSPQSLVIAPWCLASNVWNLRKLWSGTGGPDGRIPRWKIAASVFALLAVLLIAGEGAAHIMTGWGKGGVAADRLWGVPLLPHVPPAHALDAPGPELVQDAKCGWLPADGMVTAGGGAKRLLLFGGTAAATKTFGPALAAQSETTVLSAAVYAHGLDQTYLHALSILADLEATPPDVTVVVIEPEALLALGRVLAPGGPPEGGPWRLPWGKSRFVLKDEYSLSLVNVLATKDLSYEEVAEFDATCLPGAFEQTKSALHLLRWWRSRSAYLAGREPIRKLRSGEPGELATVADRLLGMFLGSAGSRTVVVFVPDREALTETDWWTAVIQPRAEQAGAVYVDLTPDLLRVGSARSLAPDFFLAPDDSGLSGAGTGTVAELLDRTIRDLLDRP